MRWFNIRGIYALDGKGKHIAGTIEPVHSGYWPHPETVQDAAYIFALARRGRFLQLNTKSLFLAVAVGPESPEQKLETVRVKVAHTHAFGLDKLFCGDYWKQVPELQRIQIQNKIAYELMSRAKPVMIKDGIPYMRDAYPYSGIAFAVSGLDELEALFPPEQ